MNISLRLNFTWIINDDILLAIDTSRAPRLGEIHGKDYYFVSREKIEEEINEGKFIEFGEYKGNLYGTSAETVKSLINSGFFCILTPHYQVRLSTVFPED